MNDSILASAMSKMPSHGEVAEFVRQAIRDHIKAQKVVRDAVALRQSRLHGDSQIADMAFELWLEGR